MDPQHANMMQTSLVQSCPHAPLELKPMHVPKPGVGRVIVRVATSTMNSLDFKIVAYGVLAQEWPWVGGNEYAGTVASVGPAVENLKVGDRIVAAAVNFIEGQEVSGWQEYALLRADLCTKIPDHVPFDRACTLPTSFAAASIALAIELGLKYPDAPPPPPKKSAASLWESAMASLGNGATFGWDLENGTVQGGAWYPNARTVEGAPLTSEQLAQRAAEDRARMEEARRKAKAREEEEDRLHAELSRAMAAQVKKRWGLPTDAQTVPDVNRQLPSATYPESNPMSWGTADMTQEAMDKQWGSGWEQGGSYRRIQVVDERRDAKGLGLVTSGLGLGLDIGHSDNWRPTGELMVPTGSGGSSGSGSASASTSMGRTGSDESNTSVSASESATGTSNPQLPSVGGPVARRGSEPSLRPPELASWPGVGSAPTVSGPGFKSSPERPLPTRPNSSGSAKSTGRSPASRGSTSPFRIPATIPRGQGRGRGSAPYTHRSRELSPLGDRPGIDAVARRDARGHAENGAPLSINGALTRHPADYVPAGSGYHTFGGARPPLREMVPVGDPPASSADDTVPLSDSFFPPPLMRIVNPIYILNEPILVWGGSTGVGRASLQLLKLANYSNLFVVAASERHAELKVTAPPGAKFFDYRHSNVEAQIRAALGHQKLNKVLDTVAMDYTLKPISRLVSAGAKVATLLPCRVPMPEGVEVKPVMFGRCNDYTGKDILSLNFGRDTMWPLLGDVLRRGVWVYPPIVRLRGNLQECARNAMRMIAAEQHVGKRFVFDITGN